MAKRAKAKKTPAKTSTRPREERAEPFFQPFAGLGKQSRQPGRERKKADPAPEKEVAGKGKSKAPPPAPAPPAPARTQRPPAKGDATPPPAEPDTFAIYMAGVRALPGDGAHRIPATASRVERAARQDAEPAVDPDAGARARMRSLVSDGLRFETVDDGERIEGRRLDVDPRDLRRLRRGQYAVDGKLDLHGLGVEEARHSVEAFVRKRAHDGDRAVIIVHGKGTHSPRGNAVLRGEIAAWLSQGRSARHVAAFATAPDDDGGTGALLVLLAR
jgi:DNA-nicking Smr family endonuclease